VIKIVQLSLLGDSVFSSPWMGTFLFPVQHRRLIFRKYSISDPTRALSQLQDGTYPFC